MISIQLQRFFLVTTCLFWVCPSCAGPKSAHQNLAGEGGTRTGAITPPKYNDLILQAIKKMPEGGGYETSSRAAKGLRYSMVFRDEKLVVNARHAVPSYCSGATYLAFLYAIKDAEKSGLVKLSRSNALALLARGQADGTGIWGRWNANGPGVARLFYETGMGVNFESWNQARPGDFMKIFWNEHIGQKEFGHLVIYQGTFKSKDDTEWVRFWSSNQPGGYGSKSVPIEKVKWAIFSRLTNLSEVNQVSEIKAKDIYLEQLLKNPSSRSEVRRMTGMP